MIQNEQFWEYWRNGEFEQAMKCTVGKKIKEKVLGYLGVQIKQKK